LIQWQRVPEQEELKRHSSALHWHYKCCRITWFWKKSHFHTLLICTIVHLYSCTFVQLHSCTFVQLPLKVCFWLHCFKLTLCVVTVNFSEQFSLKICVAILLLCFAKQSWSSICYVIRAEISCKITLIIYSNITRIWTLYVDTSLLYNTA